jgi:hypothetical protein
MQYNRTRYKFRNATRYTEREHEKKIASEAKTAPKKFRKHVNSILTSKRQISNLNNKDGSTATTLSEKANAFNSFFSSVLN